MEQVKLYDTTLRDGMGGQGMSLSVGEKLRVVAGPRRARRAFIEAGFPSSNPKEAELFELLAELELEQATIAAFGMTRRRDVARPRTTRRCATLVESFAPVVCLVGKSWGLHLEKVTRVSPRGEPGDDRRLGRLLPRAAASASSSTPSTSSTATATTPATRSNACAAAADAGAENVTLCDTNGGSLPEFVAEATAAVVADARRARSRSASTPTTTPSAAVANSLAAVEAGARLVQGTRQRLRRALRQRQPRLDPAGAAAEDGLRGASAPSSSRA